MTDKPTDIEALEKLQWRFRNGHTIEGDDYFADLVRSAKHEILELRSKLAALKASTPISPERMKG